MVPRWRWPTRLRPAFSLRSLLLAITLVACTLGYRVMPEPWQLRFKQDIDHYVSDVAISMDGELIATGEDDGPRIIVWDARTGRELRRFESPINPVLSLVNKVSSYHHELCFANEGRWLLCANGIGLVVYNLQTGKQSPATPTEGGWYTFSPQGRRVAVRGYQSKLIEVLKPSEDKTSIVRLQMEDVPKAVTFAPDSSALLVEFPDHYEWLPLDRSEPASRLRFPESGPNEDDRYVAISTNNRHVAIGDDSSLAVFRVGQENAMVTFAIESTWTARSLAWSPDSKLLAVSNPQSPRVTIIDAETGRARPAQEVEYYVALRFDEYSKRLVGRSYSEDVVWDVASGDLMARYPLPDEQTETFFSEDGNTLVFVSAAVEVWQRVYPKHWQPWLRGLYIALTSLAALALLASLYFDQRRRRRLAQQSPPAATVAT